MLAVTSGNCPALVLNADHRPLSYYPLSLWSWQDTIKAVFLERVTILEEYDRVVHSARFEMKLPFVNETELVMDVLRHGGQVTVAAPASLLIAVNAQLRAALQANAVCA